jgi:hypothetical protein
VSIEEKQKVNSCVEMFDNFFVQKVQNDGTFLKFIIK